MTVIPSDRLNIRILVAVIAAYTAAWLAIWVQPIYLAEILQYPGLSKPQAGSIVTVEVLALSLASMAGIRIWRGFRYVIIAVIGLAIALVGNLLSQISHDYVILLLARLISGIGEGTMLMVAYSALAGFADPDRAYARMALGSTALTTLFIYQVPNLGVWLGGLQTVQAMMLGLILMLPVLLIMPIKTRYLPSFTHVVKADRTPMPRAIWLIWISAFLFMIVNGIVWPFSFQLGLDSGLTAQKVNDAVAMSIAASMAGSFLTSIVGSRFGRAIPMIVGVGFAIVAVSLMIVGTRPWMFQLGINLTMFASYFVIPYFAGYAAAVDPTGRGAAAISSAGPLSLAFGAGIGGFLWLYLSHFQIACLGATTSFIAVGIILLVKAPKA